MSEAATLTVITKPRPEAPVITAVEITDEGLYVEWDDVAYAEYYVVRAYEYTQHYQPSSGYAGTYYWTYDLKFTKEIRNATETLFKEFEVKDDGKYYQISVAAYNEKGSNNGGKVAYITFKYLPRFTRQPSDISVPANTPGTLSVGASGVELHYQWQYREPGGSSWITFTSEESRAAEWTFTMKQAWDGRQYRCVVTDKENNIIRSEPMTVHVYELPLPAAPAAAPALTASGTSVTAAWEAVEGADRYTLYMSATGGFDDAEAYADIAALKKTLTGLSYDTTYTFWLKAKNLAGEGELSEPASLTLNRPPVIRRQPADLTVVEGEQGTLSISAWGTGLSYRWQCMEPGSGKWANAGGEGAAQPEWTSTMRKAWDGRQYRCVITDVIGNVIKSNRMTLTVVDEPAPPAPEPPTLQAQATSLKVTWPAARYAKSYIVYVSDTGHLEDAVQKTVNAATATTVTGLAYDTTYTVWVAGVGQAGTGEPSAPATMTLRRPPAILLQPQNVTVNAGEAAVLSISVYGEGLTFRWQFLHPVTSAWTEMEGADAARFGFTAPADWNGRQFRCVIRDDIGNEVKSNRMTLTVLNRPGTPRITALSATAATIRVSWEKAERADGYTVYASATGSVEDAAITNVGDAAAATLSDLAYDTTYTVWVRARNAEGAGELSEPMTLTLKRPPIIQRQPQDLSCAHGETRTISVTVLGEDLRYQWQLYDAALGKWTDIDEPAARQAGYTAVMQEAWSGRQYRCVIRDAIGNVVKTNRMTLTVSYRLAITKQPKGALLTTYGLIFEAQDTVYLTVEAAGEGLEFLWQRRGEGQEEWTDVGNGAEFYVTDDQVPGSIAWFRCVVTDAFGGSVTSEEALVRTDRPFERNGITYRFIEGKLNLVSGAKASGAVTLPAEIAGTPLRILAVNAFMGNSGLTRVTLPSNVRTIGTNAFRNCTNLTRMVIPQGVTSIGAQAFRGCARLVTVNVPASVKTISADAFMDCSPGLVLYGEAGSAAEAFALENDIAFQPY